MGQARDLDYIFGNIVGGNGKWQLRKSLSIWFGYNSGLMVLFITVFSTFTPSHRCFIDSCDTAESGLNETWVEFGIPLSKLYSEFILDILQQIMTKRSMEVPWKFLEFRVRS